QNTAELELEVVGLTVDGTVTALFDQPVSGLSVESQGKTDVTAADGSFTLTDLSLPYDLTVYDSIDQWAHVYHSLTHASPKVSPIYAFTGPPSGTPRGAILTGDLSGDSIP